MSLKKIEKATIQNPAAPSIVEHLQIQKEMGKVEAAWIEPGEPVVILLGAGGQPVEPGQPVHRFIYTEGQLITSDKPSPGIQGKNKLETTWLAGFIRLNEMYRDNEIQKAAEKNLQKPEFPDLVFDENTDVPTGEELLITIQAFELERDLTHKYKTEGKIGALNATKIGAKAMKILGKAQKIFRRRKQEFEAAE